MKIGDNNLLKMYHFSGTLVRSGRICIFKSCRKSSFSDFLVVWVFESMHIVGLALLVFVVLPELDVVKGAMLTNCMAFVPAVFGESFIQTGTAFLGSEILYKSLCP